VHAADENTSIDASSAAGGLGGDRRLQPDNGRLSSATDTRAAHAC